MNLETLLDSLIIEEAQHRYLRGLPPLSSEEIQKFVHTYLVELSAGVRDEIQKRK